MTNPRKTAIITGASSGFGATFAETLAKDGWNLILTGRRTDNLTKQKQRIAMHYQVSVQTFTADLSNNDDLVGFLSVIDKYTNIELLINNAGFGLIGNYFKNDFSDA